MQSICQAGTPKSAAASLANHADAIAFAREFPHRILEKYELHLSEEIMVGLSNLPNRDQAHEQTPTRSRWQVLLPTPERLRGDQQIIRADW